MRGPPTIISTSDDTEGGGSEHGSNAVDLQHGAQRTLGRPL